MRLFIKTTDNQQYKEIKLYGSERIEITSTFDNLVNPSNICGEYTESFTIPRCPQNNNVFGGYVNLDNLLNQYVYLPSIKMGFQLTTNSLDHIMSGVCHIVEINSENYTIELSGGLSRFFGRVRDLDYDKYFKKHIERNVSDIDTYHGIDANIVATSWETSNQHHRTYFDMVERGIRNTSTLAGTTEDDLYLSTLIGWAMTNADDYADFDNKKWLTRNYMNINQFYDKENLTDEEKQRIQQFRPSIYPSVVDVFRDGAGRNNKNEDLTIYLKDKMLYDFDFKTKYDIDGANEHNMQQYRSYYQYPFVWIKSWFELFQREVRGNIGYNVTIDDGIIDDEAVYVLPRFYDGVKDSNIVTQDETFVTTTPYVSIPLRSFGLEQPIDSGEWKMSAVLSGKNIHETRTDKYDINFKLSLVTTTESRGDSVYYGYFNPIIVHLTPIVRGQISSQTKVLPKRYCIVPLPTNWNDEEVQNGELKKDMIDYYGDMGYELVYATYDDMGDININISTELNGMVLKNNLLPQNYNIDNGFDYDLHLDVYFGTKINPMIYPNGYFFQFYTLNASIDNITCKRYTTDSQRTGKAINVANVLKDNNIFDIIVDYLKLKHCVWDVNDATKTVSIRRIDDYMGERFYEPMHDITRNIDFSKIEQKPFAWEYKSVEMKHSDIDEIENYDTAVIKNDKNGVSDETLQIFDEAYCCVLGQKNHKNFTTLGVDGITRCPYILPITSGDCANFYANSNWSNPEQHSFIEDSVNYPVNMRDVYKRLFYITDDTLQEAYSGVYCFHNLVYTCSDIVFDSESVFDFQHRPVGYYTSATIGTKYPQNIDINYGWSNGDVWSNRKPYVTDYNVDGVSLLYNRPTFYLYDIYGDVRTGFVYDRYINYINQLYNENNREVIAVSHLTYMEWLRIKRNPFVRIMGVVYVVASIEYYNENDGMCKLKLKKITNPFPWISDKFKPGADLVTATIYSGDTDKITCKVGTYSVMSGEKVHLYAEVNDRKNYYFEGWFDQNGRNVCVYSDYEFVVNENMTLTPRVKRYDDENYWLTLHSDGGALVAGEGRYAKNSQVSIHAVLMDGYIFKHWVDDDTHNVVSTETTTAILLNSDKSYTAVTEYTDQCKVELHTDGGCLVLGEGWYTNGIDVSIGASMFDGYEFVGWQDVNTQQIVYTTRQVTLRMNKNYQLKAITRKVE